MTYTEWESKQMRDHKLSPVSPEADWAEKGWDAAMVEMAVARAMAAEYRAWIDFFHAGNGSYDDFLKEHAFVDTHAEDEGVVDVTAHRSPDVTYYNTGKNVRTLSIKHPSATVFINNTPQLRQVDNPSAGPYHIPVGASYRVEYTGNSKEPLQWFETQEPNGS